MKRIVFLIMITGILFGQSLDLDLKVNDEKLFIGDRIKLDYTVKGNEQMFIIMPDAREWFRDIDILNISADENVKRHKKIINYSSEAVRFDTGFVHIPAMPVIAADSTGFSAPDTFYTPEKYIYIYSILDSSAAPVAVEPPLPLAFMVWWEFLIAVLLIAGSVLILIFGFKKKTKIGEEDHRVWESPKERSLHLLNALKEKAYPEHKEWKKFYLELTYILRDYFENIYFVHLQEMTTTDLLPAMKELLNASDLTAVTEFFRFADLVKFAKGVAEPERCEKHFQMVRTFVDREPEIETGQEGSVPQDNQ